MLRQCNVVRTSVLLAVIVAGSATPALADYAKYGDGMQVVASGTVVNGGLDIQSSGYWLNSGAAITSSSQTYTLNGSFSGRSCDSVVAARLVLTLWGANASNTAQVDVSINGGSLASLTIGGDGLNGSTADANPAFSANQANVYGGGSGVWLVSIPIADTSVLKTTDSNNDFSVTITPQYQGGSVPFDGRVNQVSLIEVYQKASLNNTFQYAIAEGTGDIYKATSGGAAFRTVDLGSVSTAGLQSATLHALYTYGDSGQNDRLYFDGVQLGGNDVANHQDGNTALNFVPDLVRFDVTGNLLSINSVRFSVDANDGIPGTLETSLRPSLAVLEVTSVPEPVTLGLLAIGALGVLRGGRKQG